MFDPKRVTLKQLRALAAVHETGAISGAGGLLHVTPPAVSLQLRELEENAGMALLDRRPSGCAPTQAGRELLVIARRTEAGLAICAEALAALQGGDVGAADIGVVSTAKYFAPRALAAFIKKRPKIEVRLNVANREETINALASLSIDFALMGRPPEDDIYERV
ncbi:MAG: LysR family transcriptional regulator, partial [Caulobacterales bacterium]|nr:LysR family transcriptional regulator [Caulobacterales bacterium]